MNWFKKKFDKVVKEETVESLMDEILVDPFVQLEMKLTPLVFRKRQYIEYEDYRYVFTDLIHTLSYEDKCIFFNSQKI